VSTIINLFALNLFLEREVTPQPQNPKRKIGCLVNKKNCKTVVMKKRQLMEGGGTSLIVLNSLNTLGIFKNQIYSSRSMKFKEK
jgi:hypothetical protein